MPRIQEKVQEKLAKKLKKLPGTPGVYFFLVKENNRKKIAYVGKATNLRSRVRSYFSHDIGEKRGPLIEKMMAQDLDIKFTQTDSVLEALLLEAELIKKHLPPNNTLGKDQKSFNYIVITKEDFPRIFTERGRSLEFQNLGYEVDQKFGPFPSGSELKEALKTIRRIFPYRDLKCFLPPPSQGEGLGMRSKPCFNYQIGLCPGTCVGKISKSDYKNTIRHIKLLFQGKKKVLVSNLKREMKKCAENREFEKAEKIKRQIFALQHINDIALIKDKYGVESSVPSLRIEAYDISHTAGTNIVGVMTVLEDGEPKKSDYRMFNVRGQRGPDDTKALSEVLVRRLRHPEWPFPAFIVVDGGQAQYNALESVLKVFKRETEKDIKLVSVLKDERHKPKEILGDQSIANKYKKEILLANSESHRFAIAFHRKKRSRLF